VYFLLQTLVGTWPIARERLQDYMLKAAREAKTWTSWVHQRPQAEARLRELVDAVLGDAALTAQLDALRGRLEPAAVRHFLGQTLIKLTAPGVPDIYQGSELFDDSLADPDNRRPVDYDLRERLLQSLPVSPQPEAMLAGAPGLAKLWTVATALRVRAAHSECFGVSGSYSALDACGAEQRRVVAFQRGRDVIAVVGRLTLGMEAGWQDTRVSLPAGDFRNVFTDEPASETLAQLLARFPVALLVRAGSGRRGKA
jgi:(1->4)-alpha-D-glucan 1-alpha-D-glucosylmutase